MATFNKLNAFPADVLNAVHDFDTHSFKIALGSFLPTAGTATYAAWAALNGGVNEAANGNGYTTGGKAGTLWAISTAGAIGKVTGSNVTWTASANWTNSFRYAYTYNDTPTSPADPGVCWHDYGSLVSLLNTETFTWDTTSNANGFLTLT